MIPRTRLARTIRRALALVLVALVGTGGVLGVRSLGGAGSDAAPAAAIPVLEAVTVVVGDLTASDAVDGSVEEVAARTIVHRIEGQTSSSAANSSSSASSGSSGAATGPAASAAPAGVVTPAAAESATSESATSATLAAVMLVETASPNTTPPDTTPADTTPADTTPADTTPVVSTPSSGGSGPSIGAPSAGAAPTNGSNGSSGPTGTAAAGSSGAASTSRITQLVTWVAEAGTTIGSGDALYSIEGEPVIAMYGDLPAWRTLADGVTDGEDVLQLEQNLVALGADPDRAITVDRTFDADTTAAIERWQAELGVDVTGEVALGEVVFVPTSTSVRRGLAEAGDTVGDGDGVVELAGSSLQVVIDVPDQLAALLSPGTEVAIGDEPGVVSLLRSTDRDGTVVVQAVIVPSGVLDADPNDVVNVRLDVPLADDVLIVPAEALVSRLDGSFAVELGTEADHEFVEVELVAVTGGDAGVRSDVLEVGDDVLVPA